MIDISKIFKRAWHILWNYKVLWIFGFLIAITASSGGSSGNPLSYSFNQRDQNWQNFEQNAPGLSEEFDRWLQLNVVPWFDTREEAVSSLIWIGIGLFVFILVMAVITSLIRFPSETAVLRMVNDYEQNGTKAGFRQGWKLGWSRTAFRLWVINLIISLPVILLFLAFFGVGLALFFSITNQMDFATAISSILFVGTLCLIFPFAIGMAFLNLLQRFFWRACALENLGVIDSLKYGWAMFKRNWKSAGLTWLVMLGFGIAVGIGYLILFIPLLIVSLIPAVVGVIAGGIPGALIGWLLSIFAPEWVAYLVGALVFLPIFFLITFSPFILVNGWIKVFDSTIWTLAYREIKAIEGAQPEVLPVPTPAPTA